MKWVTLTIILAVLSIFLPFYYVFGEDVKQSQLLLIPGILNECEQTINSLEVNTSGSNQIIQSLQMKVNSMLITIETQQRQLNQDLENYQNSDLIAQEKFKNYEASYLSLETSYKTSLTESQTLRQDNNDLLLKVTKQRGTIITMILVFCLLATLLITWIVIKIKSYGFSGFFKEIIQIL